MSDDYADPGDDEVNLITGQITIQMQIDPNGLKVFDTEFEGLNDDPLPAADAFAMLAFANLDVVAQAKGELG